MEAIIPCSFDFDLEKKNLKKKKKKKKIPPAPTPKKVVEDNQTIIFFRPYRSPCVSAVSVKTLQFPFFFFCSRLQHV